MFGELGIINEQLRLATIVAAEQTECAVLTSDKFKAILKPSIQSQLDQKLKFLQNEFCG